MKRTNTSLALAISFLGLLVVGIVTYNSTGGVSTVQANNGTEKCTLSRIKGSYGYTFTGFYSPSPGSNVPLAAVGVATIGEDGSINNIDTFVINGQVTENRMYSGTIALNSDNPCSGTATFTNGLKNNFVVVNEGEELQFIQTAPVEPAISLQVVVTGVARKQ